MTSKKLSTLMSVVLVVALGLYPFLVYYGLLYFDAIWVASSLILLCAARLLVGRFGLRAPSAGRGVFVICAGGILLALISFLRESHEAILFYPVVVNTTLFFVFGYSLAFPPTVIEQIARLKDGDLPPAGVAYTRRVTVVWTGFFLLNGLIAAYTALLSSLETWALYNGLIAYILIGLLLGGEWLLRGIVMRKRET